MLTQIGPAVMMSLARSRYTLPAQLIFLASNGLGMFVGIVYNGKTPDLYPNNAHHKIGWIITVVVCVHVFLSVLDTATGFMRRDGGKGAYQGLRSYMPSRLSSTGSRQGSSDAQPHRASYDSGHGTDGVTESLRSNSVSTLAENRPLRLEEGEQGFDEEESLTDVEFTRESRPSRWHGWVNKMPMGIFRRGSRAFGLWYDIIDRVILPFGFVAFTTGIATFGRFFVRQIRRRSRLEPYVRMLTWDIGGSRNLQRAGALD